MVCSQALLACAGGLRRVSSCLFQFQGPSWTSCSSLHVHFHRCSPCVLVPWAPLTLDVGASAKAIVQIRSHSQVLGVLFGRPLFNPRQVSGGPSTGLGTPECHPAYPDLATTLGRLFHCSKESCPPALGCVSPQPQGSRSGHRPGNSAASPGGGTTGTCLAASPVHDRQVPRKRHRWPHAREGMPDVTRHQVPLHTQWGGWGQSVS